MAINQIVVTGNIGKDCEQKWLQSGKAVASFSLPIKSGYGEHEKTIWANCKLFGVKAEKLPQYLTKGTKVTVSGEFSMDEWTDREGAKRSIPVIIVEKIEFSGSKQKESSNQEAKPSADFDDDIPW